MLNLWSKEMLMNTVASFEPKTFGAGSNLVQWTVPNGITKIHVDCVASKGGSSTTSGNLHGSAGGSGGRVECDLAVNGGQILYITVGNIPSDYKTASYNASDIRIGGTGYANRVIVAGGGGSGGRSNYEGAPEAGGAGGGTTGGKGGEQGWSLGGDGGTQSAGGAGGQWQAAYYGKNGNAGSLGLGGDGTNYYGNSNNGDAFSGAGGAGYYGGGSGGGSAYYSYLGNSSGGGGSSYTNANCSNVVHTQGYQDGAGYITISMVQ